jgi:uncharacterized protein (TIGR02466 family)|tara:strand:- start:988 stop:1665 length:678 start_codon:yes stop_codon:yes gene_type:complete
MKKEQLYREDYFINPIYWMEKPEWVKKLNKASDPYIKKAQKNNQLNVKERTKKFGDKGDHGMVHHSTTLIGDPKFKDLQDWILATAWNLLDEQGFDLKGHQLFLTELWVQEFSHLGGGHHTLHTHWNGHMSGFYFLKASEKTSCPVFEDPRPGRQMNLLPEKDKTKATIATSQIHYKVKPGRLIFFNSYMPHLYSVDSGYEPFRFIHWNIQAIPKGVLQHANNKK